MKALLQSSLFGLLLSLSAASMEADLTVSMNAVDEKGIAGELGQVVISETPYGLCLPRI